MSQLLQTNRYNERDIKINSRHLHRVRRLIRLMREAIETNEQLLRNIGGEGNHYRAFCLYDWILMLGGLVKLCRPL